MGNTLPRASGPSHLANRGASRCAHCMDHSPISPPTADHDARTSAGETAPIPGPAAVENGASTDAAHSHRSPGELRHNLSAMVADGLLCNVMIAAGENVFPAFVLAMGMGEVAAGQVITIPVLAGALLQLCSPWAIRRLGSLRRWVILASTAQAFSLLGAAAAAWMGSGAGVYSMVWCAVTLYWAAGLSANPAWVTWADELVPRRIRARFFAFRTRVGQVVLLVSLLGSGTLLRYGENLDLTNAASVLPYFAALFLVAAMCRFGSAVFLSAQSDGSPRGAAGDSLGLGQAFRRLSGGNSGRLIAYLLAVQTVVYMSGPYFTPYIRTELRFTYLQLTSITAVAFLGRVIALPWLGKLAHRAGPLRLMWLGGVGIVPLAAMWLVSDNFFYVCFVQFVCGVAWGAYELAMFLMFFETISRRERTSILTLYHLGNALAMFGGGLIGAAVLTYFGDAKIVYHMLFATSSVLRIGCLVLLARVRRPVIESVRTEAAEVASGALSPSTALEGAPVSAYGEAESGPTNEATVRLKIKRS